MTRRDRARQVRAAGMLVAAGLGLLAALLGGAACGLRAPTPADGALEATVGAAVAATQTAQNVPATIDAAVRATSQARSAAGAMPSPEPTGETAPTPPLGPRVAGCPVFPADNVWNARVDALPVHPDSEAYVATIGADEPLHPDFGAGTWEGEPIGIPYVDVPGTQPPVPVAFEYDDESDPGPYPIPANPPIEGGADSQGDRHILIVDRDRCILYELYSAWPQPDGSWQAGSGAIFDLRSNALRPADWTAADAAGLPMLPGLVRYDEVAAGEIRHALRFTAPQTRQAYVWPARHHASDLTQSHYPPMGQRFRLRADVDLSGFSPEVQVILQALKTYGMLLADNGAPWFISGVPDERWDNDTLVGELRRLRGTDFEAVDSSPLMVDPNSGQVRGGE
jgi:hypothetical protein